jgi:hypothetical protein
MACSDTASTRAAAGLRRLADAHLAIHSAMEQTAIPFLSPRMTKAGYAGVVRLLHAVWFGGSETPAHAWTVHARSKDVELAVPPW